MSWKFGPFVVATDEVVDINSMNSGYLSIIEEITGELNEHNFAAGSFSDRTLWSKEIGIRIHHKITEADPHAATTTVPVSTSWVPLVSDYNVTVVTTGGNLWILASYQFMCSAQYGALLALMVNGVVLGESLLGSGDIGNDRTEPPTLATGLGPDPAFVFGPAPTIWFLLDGAVVIETVLSVPPGIYTITPVYRTPRIGDNTTIRISNRELIVLEMR